MISSLYLRKKKGPSLQVEIKVDFKENLYLRKFTVRLSYKKVLATNQNLKRLTESQVAVA
jgi:hypothetical protein